MSTFLPLAAVIEFDSKVKHAYQQKEEKLRSTVRTKTGVVGESVKFPTMGKGLASKRIGTTDVKPMGVSHDKVTCPLGDWEAAEYTDIFDQAEVNYDEQNHLAGIIAGAINRRIDQIIIDAMAAANTPWTVDKDEGGADSGLTVAKLRAASRIMSENSVPETDRTFAASYRGREDLLAAEQVGSSDYNKVKALVNGDMSEFVGFSFKWIANNDEGGMPKTGTLRTNFGYHKESAGLATGANLDKRVDVAWITEKRSWLAVQDFKGGSVVIDDVGLVEVESVEAA